MSVEIDEETESSVGFLYRAMLDRDPKKRRVKPVQKHMMQLDFGPDDSSGDEDYEGEEFTDSEEDSDDSTSKGSPRAAAEDVEDCSEEDIEDESDEDEEEEEGEEESIAGLIERARQMSDQLKVEGKSGLASSKVKICICCVCLGESSDEEDEIVECDGCGVSVHEGCYGISESHSIASTESSASTEPWFCDACKAGVRPSCELCPNSGGIYKETDTGRWVHIVCALYIPGVAFGDVDKLSPVTLFEMSYSVWGAKACSICEDERFARTGVCISCDAGMCRTYFHVTCAQRQGLLSEASPDEDIADPFYAYCKVHADKFSVKAKKRNWLAIQSRVKQHAEEGKNLDNKEKLRVERKLRRHRQKFLAAKAKRPPPWVPKEKIPRFLTTSPAAVRRMMKKAELLGINPQVPNSACSKGEHKTRWHIAPALSAEFASYYLDRNVKMSNIKTQMKELLVQNNKLQDQERILRLQYDQVSSDGKQLNAINSRLRHEAEKLQKILGDILGKKLPVPEVLKPKKVIRSPTRRETPRSPPPIIHPCGICKTSRDQHLLAKCDSCKNHYHLGCLDPPLTRMPKKTKLQGWQCSECVDSSNDDSENMGIDSKAPMRLRDKIKAPVKFTPPHLQPDFFKNKRDKKKYPKSKKKIPAKRKLEEGEEEATKDEPKSEDVQPMPPKKPKASYVKKVKKVDVRTECSVCNLPGTNGNLVRCDMCKLCFHFECLDPPRKKTPKQRGYSWHCEACDSGEDESEEEEMDVENENEEENTKQEKIDKGSSPSKVKGHSPEISQEGSAKKKSSPAGGEGRRSKSPKGHPKVKGKESPAKSEESKKRKQTTPTKSDDVEEHDVPVCTKKKGPSGSPGSSTRPTSPKSSETSDGKKDSADKVSPKRAKSMSPKGEGNNKRSKTPTKSNSPKSTSPGILISPSKDLLLKAKPVIEVEDIKSPSKVKRERNPAVLTESSPKRKTGAGNKSPKMSKSPEEGKKSAKTTSPKVKTKKESQGQVKVTPDKSPSKEDKIPQELEPLDTKTGELRKSPGEKIEHGNKKDLPKIHQEPKASPEKKSKSKASKLPETAKLVDEGDDEGKAAQGSSAKTTPPAGKGKGTRNKTPDRKKTGKGESVGKSAKQKSPDGKKLAKEDNDEKNGKMKTHDVKKPEKDEYVQKGSDPKIPEGKKLGKDDSGKEKDSQPPASRKKTENVMSKKVDEFSDKEEMEGTKKTEEYDPLPKPTSRKVDENEDEKKNVLPEAYKLCSEEASACPGAKESMPCDQEEPKSKQVKPLVPDAKEDQEIKTDENH
ncbi:PHD finger protein 14 isoform X3 [Lingula anatina]|uniref:PHD finger protein 14 isoform X3 n=1 Tax=Lingula anatina TaxID=7574 RepID=A0A1S3HA25_LINAN|nr:PHD finger protein 14 isoform X3 [Lingula anatina]|eukprot:XP_013382872.1 PHD finger protein 14 isoform X3 [Lingula anatina]